MERQTALKWIPYSMKQGKRNTLASVSKKVLGEKVTNDNKEVIGKVKKVRVAETGIELGIKFSKLGMQLFQK